MVTPSWKMSWQLTPIRCNSRGITTFTNSSRISTSTTKHVQSITSWWIFPHVFHAWSYVPEIPSWNHHGNSPKTQDPHRFFAPHVRHNDCKIQSSSPPRLPASNGHSGKLCKLQRCCPPHPTRFFMLVKIRKIGNGIWVGWGKKQPLIHLAGKISSQKEVTASVFRIKFLEGFRSLLG